MTFDLKHKLIQHIVGAKYGMQVIPAPELGAELAVKEKSQIRMLVNSLVLPDYWETFYEFDKLPIPESSVPKQSKYPATIFAFSCTLFNAYSMKSGVVRASELVEAEGKRYHMVDKHECRFYDCSRVIQVQYPGESL